MKFISIWLLALLSGMNFQLSSAQDVVGIKKIAGYQPQSQVSDILNIDMDQVEMEKAIFLATDEAFKQARKYYTEGAHSESVATLTLAEPHDMGVPEGYKIVGRNVNGDSVQGTVYREVMPGSRQILFKYEIDEKTGQLCHVGANPFGNETLTGCLVRKGQVFVRGEVTFYEYDPFVDTNNGRTLQSFSSLAERDLYLCENCPYDDFLKFREYYGRSDYSNEWVTAAFDGRRTDFLEGNVDFDGLDLIGRGEAIKKGATTMGVWMAVIGKMESALAKCQSGCLDCNTESLEDWDEAVALYTGSLEGIDGSGHGYFPYELAEKRCMNFKTCGKHHNKVAGTSAVNHEIFNLFQTSQFDMLNGVCGPATNHKKRIVNLMTVPLIQGVLKYAYVVEKQTSSDKEKAQGAVFAASVLPLVYACNKDDAASIWENMAIGSVDTGFTVIRDLFAKNYKCLGITCTDVGGLYDQTTDTYFVDAFPCATPARFLRVQVFGIMFGILTGIFLLTCCCLPLRRRKIIGGKRGPDIGAPGVDYDPDDGMTETITLSRNLFII